MDLHFTLMTGEVILQNAKDKSSGDKYIKVGESSVCVYVWMLELKKERGTSKNRTNVCLCVCVCFNVSQKERVRKKEKKNMCVWLCLVSATKREGKTEQRILSVPGIGYEWVSTCKPASIGCFSKNKFCFHCTNGKLETGKMGTWSYGEPSPVKYSLERDKNILSVYVCESMCVCAWLCVCVCVWVSGKKNK